MRGLVIIGIKLCIFLSGCSTSQNHLPGKTANNKVIAGTPAPGWVWVPEYYIYDGKRYRFVKGHYRLVLSRKHYWRRSLRGYSNNREHTAAR